MKIEYKIFIIVVFLLLSIPLLFFSWALIKLEFDELIKYGNVEEAIILNSHIEPYKGASAEFGGDYRYELKILSNPDFKYGVYSAYIQDLNSSLRDKEDEEFISNVKIGDTVKIKILSSHQAKILKWKNLEINQPINSIGKLGRWILIIILSTIAFYLYFKIYKVLIK